ncbi:MULTISPECIES: pyridoxamine 5'-phosphate oxidase family protein [Spirosoma]|uniref:Pyridoxamine 5'-phosphate oxidase family protein n=1 Tax=Spirosoma liriopis TaxID=2937440 RepID=A0ABT0HQX0_9BACT|nr:MULTISPECIES: pyridoxamine 5'-phosphate oxidase family protein [Spirosoma]MCK8494584.1 pyridoxamine 5'-phosphate oxidase family protein [Spirosoma liriopis]UHG89584.1 pyridoxamine 5'-phosphate oxidase family protein [Spirosoma oryzicola]
MQAQHTLNAMELDKLRDKIKDIRIAMLTTQEVDGDFHARPMATHQMDEDGTMWFFTYDNSNKVAEIRNNERIALGFSDPGSEVYVSTSGYAEVVKDQAKINELWSDFLKTWFPNGKDDPNIALLKVTTHAGEYWDRPGGKMVKLFEMAKGAITGAADKTGRNEKFGDEPR